MANQRLTYIDALAGILILHMIFIVHCAKLCGINGMGIDIEMLLMQFFMPWFFFKSGMFFREKSLKKNFKNCFQHLVKPYIIFSLIGWIIIVLVPGLVMYHKTLGSILKDTAQHFIYDGSIRGNYALWFLLSLFFVKVLFPFLRKLRIPTIIIMLGSIVLAFSHNSIFHDLPVYLGNIPNGLFFYSIGVLLARKQFNKKFLITSIIVFIISLPFIGYLDFRANAIMSGHNNFIATELFIIAEIIIAENIANKWGEQISLLSRIGSQSMVLYVTHYIILAISFNALRILFNINNPYIMFGINTIILIISLNCICYLFKLKKLHRIFF